MKGGKQQTVTNALSPQDQRYQEEIRSRLRAEANMPYSQYGGQQVAGVNGLSNQGVQGVQNAQQQLSGMTQQNLGMGNQYNAMAMYGQGPQGPDTGAYQNAGNTGANALGGDQGAINKMMNPYQSGVIDQVKAQYGDLNAAAQMGINDQATKAGAFGGSRQGVASGVASAEIAKGLGQQVAGLQQQGFNDAMGRAGQAAGLGLNAGQLNLGFGQLGLQQRLGFGQLGQNAMGQAQQGALGQAGLAGQQFGMGDYFRNVQQQGFNQNQQNFNDQRDWGLRQAEILKGGMAGLPYGTQQSQPMQRNVGAGILGGAATGAQIGSVVPGIGTAVGAGVGGLLGLFG